MSHWRLPRSLEVLPDRLVRAEVECCKEGPAGALNEQVLVQDQHRIGNGVDDALCSDVAISQEAVEVFQIHKLPLQVCAFNFPRLKIRASV